MSLCSFLVWKNACLNYREFDLEGDLVGVPHTWYLSTQFFIKLLKLVWGEHDIVAMDEWKKKCVGLQWTWVSKHTVYCFHKCMWCAIPNSAAGQGISTLSYFWESHFKSNYTIVMMIQQWAFQQGPASPIDHHRLVLVVFIRLIQRLQFTFLQSMWSSFKRKRFTDNSSV